MFLPHPLVKLSIVGSLRDREVVCSASDSQGSNFESCVWRSVSSHSCHHTQEVLLAQFSLLCAQKWPKARFISFHFSNSFHFLFGKIFLINMLLSVMKPILCSAGCLISALLRLFLTVTICHVDPHTLSTIYHVDPHTLSTICHVYPQTLSTICHVDPHIVHNMSCGSPHIFHNMPCISPHIVHNMPCRSSHCPQYVMWIPTHCPQYAM